MVITNYIYLLITQYSSNLHSRSALMRIDGIYIQALRNGEKYSRRIIINTLIYVARIRFVVSVLDEAGAGNLGSKSASVKKCTKT